MEQEKKGTRINKFLSIAGISSRRKAEELIQKKKVKINGKVAILGQQVFDGDHVEVNGKLINSFPDKKYYLLNKPRRTICTLKDNFNRKLVTSLIDDRDYLFPVGRLDYDTTGVLLITNDGELSNKLTHPSRQIKRVYEARIDKELTNQELDFLNKNDLVINNKKSSQSIVYLGDSIYQITIHEGSYHHVKKIFEHVEREVKQLARVEFAGLTCKNLPIGTYRLLKPFEIKNLKRLAENKK